MPDITMCSGNNCELSLTCYRYKAEPSEYRQSYFVNPPNINNQCDYYWEVCKYCNQENGKHKLSCQTMKIQVNL